MNPDNRISVLIVGATGNLGKYITLECLMQPNLLVNILVRDPNKDNQLCYHVQQVGGKCLIGDITKPETIKDCTKGIHTVISAVIGDNETVIEGQKNLLEDALKNGVKRFVPSDFSFYIFNQKKGDHYFTTQRLEFKELLDKSPIKHLHVSNGFFMETYFCLNVDKFVYWGDIDQKFDLTCQDDVARYLAAAISNPDRDGELNIVGSELSTREIVEIFNRNTGKNWPAVCAGTIEDLKKQIQEHKQQGNWLEAVQLGYALAVYSGSGKIHNKHNDEFPDIKPTTLEDYVQKYYGKVQYIFPISKTAENIKKEVLNLK